MPEQNVAVASSFKAMGGAALKPPADWRAYAQLVRLPNVFTALADISLGLIVAISKGNSLSCVAPFVLLAAASGCLYCAGMVWNDFFDVEQDKRERPARPLPSGRITRKTAGLLGIILLAAGLLLAFFSGTLLPENSWTPFALACALVVAILAYDGWLKRTWCGPLGMGTCRFLNILLGLSIAGSGINWGAKVYLALIVGIYIVGVTWFARTEARQSNKSPLAIAVLVMLAGLVMALAVPAIMEPARSSFFFPYFLVVLGFLVGIPAGFAITDPSPRNVQRAVKRAIMGLVVLDAVLATAIAGAIGLTLLVLLLPALYLGRWIYST
jgi:4-hydroxybenzoate polyprenyltransferase